MRYILIIVNNDPEININVIYDIFLWFNIDLVNNKWKKENEEYIIEFIKPCLSFILNLRIKAFILYFSLLYHLFILSGQIIILVFKLFLIL